MVVSPNALRKWMSRTLRDSKRIKNAKRSQVLATIRKRWEVQPELPVELQDQQLAAFYLCVRRMSYYVNLDMGLGKTLLMLCVLLYHRQVDPTHRMLVLVPNSVNIETWMSEVEKHMPKQLSCDGLLSYVGPAKRQEMLWEREAAVVVMTYAGFSRLVCDHIKGDGRGGHLQPNDKLLRLIAKLFSHVVCDESTFLANHQSLTFRCLRKLVGKVPYRFCLSGTPFGKDPTALWSQFFFVDKGDTLGGTLGWFREAFCLATENRFSGFYEYNFDKRKKKTLSRMLRHSSIRYNDRECLDLPPVLEVEQPLGMSKEQRKYYESYGQKLYEVKSSAEATNRYIAMRQIVSGFLVLRSVESGEVVETIIFQDNPKRDRLLANIQEAPDEKWVVYHDYTQTGHIIAGALTEAGIEYNRINGKTRGKEKQLREFLRRKKSRVLVVQSQSGAYGLNLQVASRLMFYECPTSPILRQQAIGRIYRQGQTADRCFVYDLACRGTVDYSILQAQREGQDLMQKIIDGKKGLELRSLMCPSAG